MRGQPSVQLWLVLVTFALIGVPVWRLTRPEASAGQLPSFPPVVTADEVAFQITVTFAPASEEFRVSSLGQDVLAGRGPETSFHATWRTRVPAEGLDLAIQARWPATDSPVPAAARVTVHSADGDRAPLERTFWATHGNLTELLTVPGSAVP